MASGFIPGGTFASGLIDSMGDPRTKGSKAHHGPPKKLGHRAAVHKHAKHGGGPSGAKKFIDALGTNLPFGIGEGFKAIGLGQNGGGPAPPGFDDGGAGGGGGGGGGMPFFPAGRRRHRTMRVTNIKALRRAGRRLEGFVKLAHKFVKLTPHVRHKPLKGRKRA